MLRRDLPPGGEGVCPDLTMTGAGEREEGMITVCSTIEPPTVGLSYPLTGVVVGIGGAI
jgi:hypothetical protein